MGRVNGYEIIENGITYIVNEYENGTIEKFVKAVPVSVKPIEEQEQLSQTDIQEQILLNTEYLVAMQELNTLY